VDVPLVGRDRELGELRAALVSAAGGAGRLLLVGGDAGIGKTSLVTALTAMAGEYAVPVALGHAVDDRGMPPLWPWRRIAKDVPGLAALLAGNEHHDPAESAVARFAMFADAGDALVAAAAPAGLVIVLEDLHWADRTSLRLLAHLARELGEARLLVVGTYRDADGPLAETLPDLVRLPSTRVIRLAGLTDQDVAGWVRRAVRVADPDGLATTLTSNTGGNPLYLRMLLERIADTGDDTVTTHPELRRLVLTRLDRLGRDGRALLDAAAVLGERIDPPLLTAVSGHAPADVAVLLDEAVAHGVLLAGPGGELSFAHALVRDAVYDDLPLSARAGLHRRCARALAASQGADDSRIAGHWRRADGPDATAECAHWAGRAARTAIRALAYDEAVEFAALAMAVREHAPVDERAALALDLAKAHFYTGDVESTLARCQAAARLADEAGRPDLLAGAALVITGLGDPPVLAVVDRLCVAGLRNLPPDAVALRARLLAQRSLAAAAVGACDRARDLSADAMRLAEHSGDPDAELDSIHARHLSLCAPQFLAERVAIAGRAVELGEIAAQPLAALWGHIWLVDAAFQTGDLAAVDRELDHVEHFATTRQHAVAWWHLHRLRATKAALLGRFDVAVELNETARAVAERIGVLAALSMHNVFLHQLAIVRGTIDPDFAQRSLDLLRQAPDIPLAQIFVPIIHALRGDHDQARATFEEFRTLPPRLEVGVFWGPILQNIGIVACLIDDVPTAELVYTRLSTLDPDYLTDGSGAVYCAGAAPRLLGDLALTCGRTTDAIDHYRLAIEMNARIGARPFLALSRLGLATALVTHGDPTDLPTARELAGQAAAECHRLDLPGPLAAADRLLHRIAAAQRSTDPLTPRESEVVTLIAQALTNRQIAGRLVLSERTVETHVRNILAKLGLRTRTEIATRSLRTEPR
jgi:DNA-binding CsgD family transcriptional regulator/tetratricopeptide (TPR) repeat protein